jgi:uncharacterized tellurite resistance protein B-like protein
MIKSFQSFLGQFFSQQTGETEGRQRGLKLTSAALMLEVARADFREDTAERDRILELLGQAFSLSPEDTRMLLEQASSEVDSAVSLYEFTRAINDELNEQEKRQVIQMMWKVAYADDTLHRYEEHLVRKVAELIYIPNAELLRLRYEAEQESAARRRMADSK